MHTFSATYTLFINKDKNQVGICAGRMRFRKPKHINIISSYVTTSKIWIRRKKVADKAFPGGTKLTEARSSFSVAIKTSLLDGTGELCVVYTGYAIDLIERNGISKERMEKERDLTSGSGTEWWMASGT
jgi:hypothetical protein